MASELATGLGSPLLVLHVVHDSADHPGQYRDPEATNYSTPMVEVAHKKLHSLVSQQAESRPEVECLKSARVLLLEGLPSQRILETAEAEHPRMIVMGKHDRNGLSRVMSGSVSEDVVRASRVSVTVVKGLRDS